jgi:hypothetical protein
MYPHFSNNEHDIRLTINRAPGESVQSFHERAEKIREQFLQVVKKLHDTPTETSETAEPEPPEHRGLKERARRIGVYKQALAEQGISPDVIDQLLLDYARSK